MQLSAYSDYALRMLMMLALDPTRRYTIREIAAAYGISHNHLMKIAQDLGRHRYIETVRGRGGGLRLGMPAEEINVGAVVRRTEENLALVECFDPARNRCVITGACGLRLVLKEALEAFLAVLDRFTLSDLTRDKRALGLALFQNGMLGAAPDTATVPSHATDGEGRRRSSLDGG